MRTMRRFAVVAACSLPLLLAGCTAAAPDVTTDVALLPHAVANSDPSTSGLPAANPVEVAVTGVARSSTGAPLPGAVVDIRPASSGRDCLGCSSASIRTDGAGRFALTLARGDYLVGCTASGGVVCRLEDADGSGRFTVVAGARDLVLLAGRSAG